MADFPPENAERAIVNAPQPTGGVVTLVVSGNVTPLALRLAAEEIERELELARKKRELDKIRFERSDELVEHLDSIFEEAHRHNPRRKAHQ